MCWLLLVRGLLFAGNFRSVYCSVAGCNESGVTECNATLSLTRVSVHDQNMYVYPNLVVCDLGSVKSVSELHAAGGGIFWLHET